VGFEPTIPVFERAKTIHAFDRVATVISFNGTHGVISQKLQALLTTGVRTSNPRYPLIPACIFPVNYKKLASILKFLKPIT
jgi:hypothetical protein